MMHEFRWQGMAVHRLLDESRAAAERFMTFSERLEAAGLADSEIDDWSAVDAFPDRGAAVAPAIHFVSDHGVYLMSNAVLPPDTKRQVIYAAGYNPDKDPFEQWHIGGDDFVERLGEEVFRGLGADDVLFIRLDPRGDTFEIGIESAKRTRK